jgi:hypothetical protein
MTPGYGDVKAPGVQNGGEGKGGWNGSERTEESALICSVTFWVFLRVCNVQDQQAVAAPAATIAGATVCPVLFSWPIFLTRLSSDSENVFTLVQTAQPDVNLTETIQFTDAPTDDILTREQVEEFKVKFMLSGYMRSHYIGCIVV